MVKTRKMTEPERVQMLQCVLREAQRWGIEIENRVSPRLTRRERARRYELSLEDETRLVLHTQFDGMFLMCRRMRSGDGPFYDHYCKPVKIIANLARLSTHKDGPIMLLHELMHVVEGVCPNYSHEAMLLLALEYEAAHRLKIPWSDWMKDFRVPTHDGLHRRWTSLTQRERHLFLAGAQHLAQRRGLMLNGRPTYVRPARVVRNYD